MEVTHNQDFDTHAIIGGAEIMEFGVAQTAEFFEVLSNTLYSDKPLAVVREVLCNAWDAHIVSGNMDKPVEVNITSDKLVIRDFGPGIPHKLIHPIYCVYGNSTKKNDGNQTGGFGLGSKSPFAYTTHFTVTSCHEGTKTVYAISRGSAKTNGKPDCRVMVKLPTTESGLEVSIPLKNSDDKEMFEEIVTRIARMGDMNVLLNGTKLSTINLHHSDEGFLLTRDVFTKAQEKIFVRYGNVVYPVPMHEDYASEYKKIYGFLEAMPTIDRYGYNNEQWKLIFQAPANKISVTPSRESLSLTDTTIETLKSLFVKIHSTHSQEFRDFSDQYLREYVADHWSSFTQFKLLNFVDKDKRINGQINILSYKDAVYTILNYQFPKDSEFQKKLFNLKVQSFIENGYKTHIMKKLIKSYDEYTKLHYHWHQMRFWGQFLARNVTGSLMTKIMNSDLVNKKYMFIGTKKNQYTQTGFEFTEVPKFSPENACFVGGLLRNFVVLTHSKVAVNDYFYNRPQVRQGYDVGSAFFVYLAPRNKVSKDNALKFFKSIGMEVIDLISYVESITPAAPVTPIPKELKEPKIKGIPTLRNLCNHKQTRFNPRGHLIDNPVRIENPEYVMQPHSLTRNGYDTKFFSFGDSIANRIVNLWGHLGGVCINSRQVEAYKKKGSKDGYEWIAERLLLEFQTNTKLLKHTSFRLAPWFKDTNNNIINVVHHLQYVSRFSDVIKKEFQFPDALSYEEEDLIHIWNELRKAYDKKNNPYYYGKSIPKEMDNALTELHKLVEDQVADPQFTVISNMLKDSKMFRLIDFDECIKILSNDKTDAKQKSDIEALLLIALQG